MYFHALSGEVGFFGDDAGDFQKMCPERRFSVSIFIVFMIYWMPYCFLGFVIAACMIFVQ